MFSNMSTIDKMATSPKGKIIEGIQKLSVLLIFFSALSPVIAVFRHFIRTPNRDGVCKKYQGFDLKIWIIGPSQIQNLLILSIDRSMLVKASFGGILGLVFSKIFNFLRNKIFETCF